MNNVVMEWKYFVYVSKLHVTLTHATLDSTGMNKPSFILDHMTPPRTDICLAMRTVRFVAKADYLHIISLLIEFSAKTYKKVIKRTLKFKLKCTEYVPFFKGPMLAAKGLLKTASTGQI